MKLSKTMQEALDRMKAADWYYMHNGKTCENFVTETVVRSIGFEGAGIVEGGYVYARMDSKTLEALRKRGAVEVAHDGKQWLDVVKVAGMELPERLTKALMVKVTRKWTEYPDSKPQELIGYAVNEECVQRLVERFTTKSTAITEVTVVGEVELQVWDFFKNK